MGVKKLPKVKELQVEYASYWRKRKKSMPSTSIPVRKYENF